MDDLSADIFKKPDHPWKKQKKGIEFLNDGAIIDAMEA